jgi:hypothetical protein
LVPIPAERQPLKRSFRRHLRVFGTCLVYGGVYGALVAASGDLMMEFICNARLPDLTPLVLCTLVGGACGAFGGGVAGFVGNFVGARWGWWMSGGVGGLMSPLMFWLIVIRPGYVGPPVLADLALMGAIGWLTGGVLGERLGWRLRGGKPRLPGVERLARIISDGNPPLPAGKPRGLLAEVVPAAAPTGRGDELASVPSLGLDP